jgi:iron complex transport system substrate-binding protein
MDRRDLLVRTGVLVAAAALPAGLAAQGARPVRIIALGGDVAEIVHALGHGHRLIGCDDSCQYPPAITRLPRAGYVRAFSAEGVLALRPDLVLAADHAGPAAALSQLRSARVAVVVIPEARDGPSLIAKVTAVARALGDDAAGNRLATTIGSDLEALATRVASTQRRPSVLALMASARGGLMAAGDGTASDAVITLAGGRNVFDVAGMRPLAPEAALAADPDHILLPSHAAQGLGGARGVRANPALAPTRAAREGRIIVLDSLKLLGFGPRTPEAASELFAILHPRRAR